MKTICFSLLLLILISCTEENKSIMPQNKSSEIKTVKTNPSLIEIPWIDRNVFVGC
jgi:hypothetical protein